MKTKIKNKKQPKKSARLIVKKVKKQPIRAVKTKNKASKKIKAVRVKSEPGIKKVVRNGRRRPARIRVAANKRNIEEEKHDNYFLPEVSAPSPEMLIAADPFSPAVEPAVPANQPVDKTDFKILFDVTPADEESIKVDIGRRIRSNYFLNLLCPAKDPAIDKIIAANSASAKSFSVEPSRFSTLNPVINKQSRPAAKPAKKTGIDFIARQKSGRHLKSFISALAARLVGYFQLTEEIQYLEEPIEDIFARPDYFLLLGLRVPRNWYQRVAVFAVVAIIFVLPLQAYTYYQDLLDTKERVLLATDLAINNLKSGSKAATALDLNTAGTEFDQAKLNFISAEKEINQLNSLTTEILKILPGQDTKIESASALLGAGEIIAETGRILVDGGRSFLVGNDFSNYFSTLLDFRASLETAISKFGQAKEKILQVRESDLPPANQETFRNIKTFLPEIEDGLSASVQSQ